jgi:hypothetical protein
VAREPEKQADGTAHQQKAQADEDVWVAMAKAVRKVREHQTGSEAEIADGKNAAGLGIELATMKQAHGKFLQKI